MMTTSPCRRRPTHTAHAACAAPTPGARAEAMLRDMAFVLHLTEKVAGQIMAERDGDQASLSLAACDECF